MVLAPSIVQDPDVWWHLRTGQWIVESRALPQVDPFTVWGSDKPWVAYTWAFDVALFAAWQFAGMFALPTVVAAACAAVAVWALRAGERAGHSRPYTFAVIGLALLALNGFATPRPWWASVLCVIALLEILRNDRDVPLRVAVLMAVWSNLHIQFVYGLVVLGLWVMLRRRSLAALGAGGLATLLNPYGIGVHLQALDYARHGSLSRYVEELRPPDFSEPWMWFVGMTGVIAAVALWRGRTRDLWHVSLLVLGAVLFLKSRRDGWFLVIASVYALLDGVAFVRWQVGAALARFAVAGSVLLCAAGVFRSRPNALRDAVAEVFPAHAIQHVPTSGVVFTPFDWGGFVVWMRPGVRVTFDGRTNVHGVDRSARLLEMWHTGRGWESEAADAVIAPPRGPLAGALRAHYRVVYEDAVAVVFAAR